MIDRVGRCPARFRICIYHDTDSSMLTAVWRLRHNISAYDAAYIALAQAYEVPLATFDQRLAKAAAPLGVTVTMPS